MVHIKKKKKKFFKNKKDLPGGPVFWSLSAGAGETDLIPHPGRSHIPQSNEAHGPQLLSLREATAEAWVPRARALQREKPPHGEASPLQLESIPRCN